MKKTFGFIRKPVTLMTSALLVLMGVPLTAVPVQAVTPTCTAAGITLTPMHRPDATLRPFYSSSSSGSTLHSNYVGYTINDTTGKALGNNIWVKLSGFTGGSLGLAAKQSANVPARAKSASNLPIVYSYLTASTITATAQSFTVEVWNGDPTVNGTQVCTYGDGFSQVTGILAAAANRVTSVSAAPSSPSIGTFFNITAAGETGVRGSVASDVFNGNTGINISPAMDDNWPADSLALEGITFNINGTTYDDYVRVYPSGTANVAYSVTYKLQARAPTTSATSVAPVQVIASGTQMKYTGSYSAGTNISVPSPVIAFSITKNLSSITGVGPTWEASYSTTITNSGTGEVIFDNLVDDPSPDTNWSFLPGSAKLDNVAVADPVTLGGKLYFAGPVTLPISGSVTLTYKLTLSGTTTNTIVADIADITSGGTTATNTVEVIPPLNIVTTTVPVGAQTYVYSTTPTAYGGTPPYTWTVSSGTLPPGLTLNSTTGEISGTPTTPGTYTFTLKVTDNTSPTSYTDIQQYTLIIQDPVVITTTNIPYTNVGKAYNQTLNAIGGNGAPYTWRVVSGSTGEFTLNSDGTVTGTATIPGVYTFTAEASDSLGRTDEQQYILYVTNTVIITTPSLPTGEAGTSYSTFVEGTGGKTNYIWSVASGSLPSGLSLNSATGEISGTPTTAGSYPVTLRLTDSVPAVNNGPETTTKEYTILINEPVSITTLTVPDGINSVNYTTTTLNAAGGDGGPYIWTLDSGSLPTGLTLSLGGVISGKPTVTGDYTFTVKATDGLGRTATKTYTVAIADTIQITTTALADGKVAYTYIQQLENTGGIGPYTWAITDGTLPDGITLDPSTGLISGMTDIPGIYTITVSVTDSLDAASGGPLTATRSYSFAIIEQVHIMTLTVPNGVQGKAYYESLFGEGGTAPYRWSVESGNLPTGITLDSSTGVISGTPTTVGTYTFTVMITDDKNDTYSREFTINVIPPVEITTLTTPNGIINTSYSKTITAAGGTTPYTWSVSDGVLPDGLTLDSATGEISGTPTQTGSYTFTVKVVDSTTAVDGGQLETTKAYTIGIIDPLRIETETLPNGVSSQSYSTQILGTGGTTPYVWTVSVGRLPTGLSLDSATGEISGTPTQTGSYTFTVKLTDSKAVETTYQYTINIIEPVAIATLTLPNGSTHLPYSETVTATGGTIPYAWGVSDGSLPDGLTLDPATGEIAGQPTTAGTYTFTVKVEDSTPAVDGGKLTDAQAYTITIIHPLDIDTLSIPNGVSGQKYFTTIVGSGGTTPYAWTISDGTLPTGLTLDSATGEISGTPTQTGEFTITVKLTDDKNNTVEKTYTLTVIAPVDITTLSLPNGVTGVSYSENITSANGTSPYTWSVSDGVLPDGLTLNPATGEISGTPTKVGMYTFTIKVLDSTPVADGGTTEDAQTYTVKIIDPLVITTVTVPSGVVGKTYERTLEASGGTGPYTWNVSKDSLPTGLTLNENTGTISGTPTIAGTYTYTVEVTDADGIKQTKTFTITIINPVTITTLTLPNGSTALAYSETLQAVNGTSPYTWILVSGKLPSGTSLNKDTGTISGNPTTAGTYTFAIKVVDSTLAENGARTQDTRSYTVRITDPLSIVTTSLHNGVAGINYSHEVVAEGGTEPYTWTIEEGSLPDGLSFDESTGKIIGTPTTIGAFPITFKVTDADGVTQTKTFTITIINPVTITTLTLPNGSTASAYSETLDAVNGTEPYLWELRNGELPTGLTLDTETGVVSGQPTTAGTYTFTVIVIDSTSVQNSGPTSDTQAYTVKIIDPLVITTVTVPSGVVGKTYERTLEASGGTGPYTWNVSKDSLPTGLTLNENTGTISGTPTIAGTYTYTVEVTDADGIKQTKTFTITIINPVTITTLTLPNGSTASAYSESIAASDGTSPYSWAVTSGSLPTGLTLDETTGTVSGQPTTAGTYTFTIKVVDSTLAENGGATEDAQTYTVEIIDPVYIITPSIPNGVMGVSYEKNLTAGGGTGPYTWEVSGGNLPTGLTLDSSTGLISGTPTAAGTYTFTAKVTDSTLLVDNGPTTDTQTYTIEIIESVVITTLTTPNGVKSISYAVTLNGSNGTGPYAWTVSKGSLPTGLTLDENTGEISGIPTTAGIYMFTIKVTDSTLPANGGATSDTQTYTIEIIEPVVITTLTTPNGVKSVSYTEPLNAINGTESYSWSLISGVLPSGLTLDEGTGVISGTPTTAGIYMFTIKVTDSTLPANGGATSDTQTYTIEIIEPVVITTLTTPNGVKGVSYEKTLSGVKGTSPYLWSVVLGDLPMGLSLDTNTGVISGTPTTLGTYVFTVKVTDSTLATDYGATSDTRAYTIEIIEPVKIDTLTLSNGVKDVAYAKSLQGSGGTTPYSWVVTSGTLPTGLAISSATGEISGVPTVSGSYTFTVELADSTAVEDNGPTSDTKTYTIEIIDPITITTLDVPNGVSGVSYEKTLKSNGGTNPQNWEVVLGSLPFGLTLDNEIGVISGTPTSAGTYVFTVKVTDSTLAADYGPTSDTKTYMITVIIPVTIDTSSVPDTVKGTSYETTLNASDGTAPYVWTVSKDALPPGLSLNENTGVISGVTTTAGSYTFTVKVTDNTSAGDNGPTSDTKAYTIVVVEPLSIDTLSLPNGVEGTVYETPIEASGGTGPYAWEVSGGNLPTGLMIDSKTGVISGTPTTPGTYTFTIKVTDDNGKTSTKTFSMDIIASLQITTVSLPKGTTQANYNAVVEGSGGTTPYEWSVSSGSLPTGLKLDSSTGTISGVPTVAGSYTFTIKVIDSTTVANSGPLVAVKNFTITINDPLKINTLTLPNTLVDATYQEPIVASGGNTSGKNIRTWGIIAGTLPPGLEINAYTGAISGIATSQGTYTFTVAVEDQSGEVATQEYTVIVAEAVAITTLSIPDARQTTEYSHVLTAIGGIEPYTWEITAGSLPDGLTLGAGNGIISGTPTVAGSYTFTVKVTDKDGNFDTKEYTMVVTAPIEILTKGLPDALTNATYSTTLEGAGGTTPYTWGIISGNLPAGLSLDGATGVISGMPTEAGTFTIEVKLTDKNGNSTTKSFTFSVNQNIIIMMPFFPEGTVGVAYEQDIPVEGGVAPYTWSIVGGVLPPGLSLDPSTGVVSGVPTEAGKFDITIKVTDSTMTAVVVSIDSTESQTPTASPSPTSSESPTATPEPTASESPTATPEPTASVNPTATPEPTASVNPTATPEPTASENPSISETAAGMVIEEETPAPAASGMPVASPDPEPTASENPTATPEPTSSASASAKPSASADVEMIADPLTVTKDSSITIKAAPKPNPPNPPAPEPTPTTSPAPEPTPTTSPAPEPTPTTSTASTPTDGGFSGSTVKVYAETQVGTPVKVEFAEALPTLPVGDTWETKETRIIDPETGTMHTTVVTPDGTWSINPTTGEIDFMPAPGFSGLATATIIMYSSSGQAYTVRAAVKVSETVAPKRVVKETSVYFAPYSSKLSPTGKAKLQLVAKQLRNHPDGTKRIAIIGYVQPNSVYSNDMSLSTARATAVYDYLKALGVKDSAIYKGVGRAEQMDWRARRVDVTFSYNVKK